MNRSSTPTGELARWRFGTTEFDELRWELRVRGQVVAMERKPLEVLGQLLRHPGEVVSKDELLESAWAGRVVVENALSNAVAKLRRAIGDEDQTVLVTVPRVGYRLQAVVERNPSAEPASPPRRLSVYPAVGILMLASAIMALSLVAYLIAPWQGLIPADSRDVFVAANFVCGLALFAVALWRIRKASGPPERRRATRQPIPA